MSIEQEQELAPFTWEEADREWELWSAERASSAAPEASPRPELVEEALLALEVEKLARKACCSVVEETGLELKLSELVELSELAELSELDDKDTSAIDRPQRVVPDRSSSPAMAFRNSLASPSSTLQERFVMLVMRDFTPRRPSELPMAQWASYKLLFHMLQPHAAPSEARHVGPANLKQLITEWYKDHPAFAGLPSSAWCKKLTDKDPQARPRSQVYKFCFEYTPGGQTGH